MILSPRARQDLTDIGDWIARDDPDRAITFVQELRAACRDLATFPRAYPPCPRFGPAARRRNHGAYAIIYDVTAEDVHVLTVVHGARDLDSLI